MAISTNLPTWDDQMEALKGVADHLLATWRPDGATEAEVQDMNKLALSILACGYFCHVYTDTRRPVFMPLWNFASTRAVPTPTTSTSKRRSREPGSTNSSDAAAPSDSSRSPSRHPG